MAHRDDTLWVVHHIIFREFGKKSSTVCLFISNMKRKKKTNLYTLLSTVKLIDACAFAFWMTSHMNQAPQPKESVLKKRRLECPRIAG